MCADEVIVAPHRSAAKFLSTTAHRASGAHADCRSCGESVRLCVSLSKRCVKKFVQASRMSLQGIRDWIWSLNHEDEEYQAWGSGYEILFWFVVLVAHFGLVIYAAWSLAVKHTEATGSSVLVPVKADEASASASGDSSLLGSTTRRKNRGLLSRFYRSS